MPCAPAAARWAQELAGGDPILLTYMTSVPRDWPLAISAALHGLPLVLQGVAQPWVGPGVRVHASREAATLLQAVAPSSTVASVHGSDLLVANAITAELKQRLRTMAAANEVLVAGECSASPFCYRDAFAADEEHQKCLRSGSAACYPNAGLYIASPRALVPLLTTWESVRMANDAPEHWSGMSSSDQLALHRLYLNRSAWLDPSSTRLRLDTDNQLHLSLYACKQEERLSHDLRRRRRQLARCTSRDFDPLSMLEISSNPHGLGLSVVLRDGGRAPARPLFVHANGNHSRLDSLTRMLLDQMRINPSAYARISRHPVLLIDAHPTFAPLQGAPCGVLPLGVLMNGSYSAQPARHNPPVAELVEQARSSSQIPAERNGIIDLLSFNDEIDMLSYRLRLHSQFVQQFVIIECDVTYSGAPKKLYAHEMLLKEYDRANDAHPSSTRPMLVFEGAWEGLQYRFTDITLAEPACRIRLVNLTLLPPRNLRHSAGHANVTAAWSRELQVRKFITHFVSSEFSGGQIVIISDVDELFDPAEAGQIRQDGNCVDGIANS
ncbi:hypothetical protein AB1Y20_019880 [Prymnesium parvum]|uniref:Glycosyltransferase family 92 protein n=1 Tax=Prymnesium parvum TaxID=97485 RepID=A0AB34JTJ4_PRYPA